MTTLWVSLVAAPSKSGNPGRPPDLGRESLRCWNSWQRGKASRFFKKSLEGALAGDGPCQEMLMDRLWPSRKGQPVNVIMPPINTPQDVFLAIASIWTAIGEGRLTPDEANALSIVMDRWIQAIELHDITKRVAALEEARDKRDEKNDPPSD